MTQLKRYRHIPVQIGILLTLFSAFMWTKWSNAPAPFTADYTTGFHIFHLMLLTVVLWVASGFYGIGRFAQNEFRLLWVGTLLILSGWITISQTWAYGIEDYPGLSPNAVLQFALVTLFAVTCACAAPKLRWVIAVLAAALMLHGIIGSVQVIQQSSIGLSDFGEINLNPGKSGISVIQSGDVRWLRPYGLLPHPNIYAGLITLALLVTAAWVFDDNSRLRWIGVGVFTFGFFVLLLTFSRGAWVGFAVGILSALPFVMRLDNFWRKLVPLAGLTVIAGIIFIIMFQPLLLSRAGVGQEGVEMRSLSDRVVFNRIAREAIREYPFQGVGIANYQWYASVYIFFNTDYDLRGTHVHNIYYLLLAELGVIGFGLFVVVYGGGCGYYRPASTVQTTEYRTGCLTRRGSRLRSDWDGRPLSLDAH